MGAIFTRPTENLVDENPTRTTRDVCFILAMQLVLHEHREPNSARNRWRWAIARVRMIRALRLIWAWTGSFQNLNQIRRGTAVWRDVASIKSTVTRKLAALRSKELFGHLIRKNLLLFATDDARRSNRMKERQFHLAVTASMREESMSRRISVACALEKFQTCVNYS